MLFFSSCIDHLQPSPPALPFLSLPLECPPHSLSLSTPASDPASHPPTGLRIHYFKPSALEICSRLIRRIYSTSCHQYEKPEIPFFNSSMNSKIKCDSKNIYGNSFLKFNFIILYANAQYCTTRSKIIYSYIWLDYLSTMIK